MFENPTLGVLLISIITTLTLTLVYKFATDQEKLKELNEKMKEMNKKLKEAQKNKDQKELMKLQSKILEINNEKMKSSMKVMMISFIIIIPVFLYVLPGLYGDVKAVLDESLQGTITLDGNEKTVRVVQKEPITIEIDGKKLEDTFYLGDKEFAFKEFDEKKKTITFKRVAVNLPFSLPIWGSHIGWLGWYIIISIPMSTLFRKMFGVVQ